MVKNNYCETNYFNTGEDPQFMPIDIGHEEYVAVIEPDSAFWTLVRKEELGNILCGGSLMEMYREKQKDFISEIDHLRFGLKPSAVYFNPTERCNLNCKYCYIPEGMRQNGPHMSEDNLLLALEILKNYFSEILPEEQTPQIIFHGSEPMMNKTAMFAGIKKFRDDFIFGIQTNATLLEDSDIAFIREFNVNLGISIDGPGPEVADRLRVDWSGQGYFSKVEPILDKFAGYPGFNVICTVTSENLEQLPQVIEYYHRKNVETCLMNIVRCTRAPARTVKPGDDAAAEYFIKALDRGYELYQKTGRKMVVGNFANILRAIIAPSSRHLMCDISPCGGGRCFFAIAADGGMFPCSEFVGLTDFRGGNIFRDKIPETLNTPAFKKVTGRKVENIEFCNSCAIRHFCGSPCPAEAHSMNGGMEKRGAFCRFYEAQTRYAFRLIADGKANAFLPDNWDETLETVIDTTQATV